MSNALTHNFSFADPTASAIQQNSFTAYLKVSIECVCLSVLLRLCFDISPIDMMLWIFAALPISQARGKSSSRIWCLCPGLCLIEDSGPPHNYSIRMTCMMYHIRASLVGAETREEPLLICFAALGSPKRDPCVCFPPRHFIYVTYI